MEFKQAYEALKQGADIKRPSWKGFWRKKDGTIVMYCKDGSKVPFLETECIFVDFDNIVANDWEVVDGYAITDLNVTTFTFGEAISRLKRGQKVARKGWKDMWLYLINPGNAMCKGFAMQPCIGMKTANEVMQPGWLASQTDILSEDWIVIG